MEQGFAESDVILEHTFHTAITDHAFLEPECSIAVPLADGRMEIYVGSQIPYQDRDAGGARDGLADRACPHCGQLMGGGFGGKEDVMGQIHVAMLANVTQRPVKLLFDRHESLLVHPKRHATQIRVKMGAKKDGCLVAMETELYGDTGAYASLGEKVMTRATTHSAGPYDIPNVRADCYAMYTNNPPAGAFRGFGVTQSAFAVESMMDKLAETLNLDPVEAAPHERSACRQHHQYGTGFEGIGWIDASALIKWMRKCASTTRMPFKPVADPVNPHLVRSWGFASAYKNTGLGGGAPDISGADVELYEDGTFQVRSSAAELGQGLVTVMRLIVSEEMSVAPEQVRVLVMDTDLTPNGGPTTASRQTFVTGNASRYAAKTLARSDHCLHGGKISMCVPEQIRFEDGIVHVNGHSLTYAEIYKEMTALGQQPRVRYDVRSAEDPAAWYGR